MSKANETVALTDTKLALLMEQSATSALWRRIPQYVNVIMMFVLFWGQCYVLSCAKALVLCNSSARSHKHSVYCCRNCTSQKLRLTVTSSSQWCRFVNGTRKTPIMRINAKSPPVDLDLAMNKHCIQYVFNNINVDIIWKVGIKTRFKVTV